MSKIIITPRYLQLYTLVSTVPFYRRFVRPHLECASIVWNPGLVGDTDKLEDVQKFALRVCFKSWELSCNDLLSNARLPPLQKRRLQAQLFKNLHPYNLVQMSMIPAKHYFQCHRQEQTTTNIPFFLILLHFGIACPECHSIVSFKIFVDSINLAIVILCYSIILGTLIISFATRVSLLIM